MSGNLKRRNPRPGWNNPHPNSTAGRVRTGGDAKLKKALHDWLNEVNDDAKAYEPLVVLVQENTVMEHGQLTETERAGLLFGVAVSRRFLQRCREMPEIGMQALVALSAADIYQVMVDSEDPIVAVDEFLMAEEMMAE